MKKSPSETFLSLENDVYLCFDVVTATLLRTDIIVHIWQKIIKILDFLQFHAMIWKANVMDHY